MALIQLRGEAAEAYRSYLQGYRLWAGKEPGPVERTEAFFCARSGNPWTRPAWCR